MMSKLYRFDVDYLDEERGIKHIPCDDGDYVLAEDALALQAKIEELEEALDEKETPAAEVYELRKACRIYKELAQEKKAKIEELTGLLREHLYAPDNQKIREWEDLAKRSRAALKQEGE